MATLSDYEWTNGWRDLVPLAQLIGKVLEKCGIEGLTPEAAERELKRMLAHTACECRQNPRDFAAMLRRIADDFEDAHEQAFTEISEDTRKAHEAFKNQKA